MGRATAAKGEEAKAQGKAPLGHLQDQQRSLCLSTRRPSSLPSAHGQLAQVSAPLTLHCSYRIPQSSPHNPKSQVWQNAMLFLTDPITPAFKRSRFGWLTTVTIPSCLG